MNLRDEASNQEAGFFKKLLLFAAGVSWDRLARCPKADHDLAMGLGAIMICVWIYQGSVFSLVAHRIFDSTQFHISFVIASFFIATFVLVIDAHTINRIGFFHFGIREIAAGGLKLPRRLADTLSTSMSAVIRYMLAGCMALLMSSTFPLLYFAPDIQAEMVKNDHAANFANYREAAQTVDAEKKATADALKDKKARISVLEKRVDQVRRKEIKGGQPLPKAGQPKPIELASLEKNLGDEDQKLVALKAQFDSESQGRADAIRIAVQKSPNYVPPNEGLIEQLIILGHLADRDIKIKLVIILIDIASFSLEAAALFGKMAYIPSVYAGLVAKEGYLHSVWMVDELMEELGNRPGKRTEVTPAALSNTHSIENGLGLIPGARPTDGGEELQPPKRPRGRPRKEPLN